MSKHASSSSLVFALLLFAIWGLTPSGLSAQPPHFYLMTDIGPGSAVETRAGAATLPSSTIGNFSGAFGCPGSVIRNGFFLANDWQIFPLCPLSGDVESVVSSFETSGTVSVVGRSISAGGRELPVQWNRQSDGTFLPKQIFLPLGSLEGIAYGTDFAARLTGEIDSGGVRVPAYWFSATSTPQVFPQPGVGQGRKISGNTSEALIAGVHQDHFFLWYPSRTSPGNVLFPLGTTPSIPRSVRWSADPPLVAGSMTLPQGVRGFIWRGTPPEDQLGTLGGAFSEAWDILPSTQQIVGGATDAAEEQRAALWEGGNLYDLNQALLPVCRAGDPSLCAPTLLQNASSITENGMIVGQALISGDLHAILLRPVTPFTWTLGACAGGSPYCVALGNPVYSSSALYSAPVYQKVSAAGGETQSAVTTQAARARSSTASANLHSESQFQNYVVLENLSLAKLLAPGSSTVRVNFHFQVKAGLSGCLSRNQTGSTKLSLMVRPPRQAGSYATATGSLQFTGTDPIQAFGVFTSHPAGGSFEVVVPVDLSPRSNIVDKLELRIEGQASSFAFAFSGGCSTSDITVQFCPQDPAAITLDDGTPLASAGVRYVLWPTVTPAPDCGDLPL